MKRLWFLFLLAVLLTGCASSAAEEAPIVDTGEPGKIQVSVFLDTNGNKRWSPGESGVSDRVGVMPVKNGCGETDLDAMTRAETDPNGNVTFGDLKPGKYCVMYMGSGSTTTRLNVFVPLSSEQLVNVVFGLTVR